MSGTTDPTQSSPPAADGPPDPAIADLSRRGRRDAGPTSPADAVVPDPDRARAPAAVPGPTDRPGAGTPRPATIPGRGGGRGGNPVGWTALLLAVVLTAWKAVYAVAAQRVGDPALYESISLFVSLILGLSAAVLGIVALAQRHGPRWPGLVGLAIGLHVFVVALFFWIGTLAGVGA
ncbi:MAG: hypothetical protein ACYC1Z_15010 [Georgenia sp.]